MAANESRERSVPSESSKNTGSGARGHGARNDPPRHIPQRQESNNRHNDRSGGSGANTRTSLFAPAAVNHPAPKYEDRTERYRRERDEAETLVESMKCELTKLEQELSAQQDAVHKTKESATRVRLAMQDKELFIGPQALDRIVQEKFITLFKNVRTSSRFLNGEEPVNLQSFKPEVRKQFDIIAPGLDDAGICNLLNGKTTRRYFLQGWIALVMTERLFPTLPDEEYHGSDTKDLWLEGSQAENLWYLERALFNRAVNPKDLNDWRAYSASLLWKSRVSDNFPTSTHDYMRKLCEEVLETAGICCPDYHKRKKFAAELFNIFSEAVHFVRLLRVQRAQWSLRFPKTCNTAPKILLQQGQLNSLDTQRHSIVMFDQYTMKGIEPHDDDERTDNKFVQIFARPALFKRGDTDGEKFDVFSCIEASGVAWGELPIHHASPQESPSNPKKPSLSPRSMSEIAGPESSRDPGYEDVEMDDSEPRDTSRKNGSWLPKWPGTGRDHSKKASEINDF